MTLRKLKYAYQLQFKTLNYYDDLQGVFDKMIELSVPEEELVEALQQFALTNRCEAVFGDIYHTFLYAK